MSRPINENKMLAAMTIKLPTSLRKELEVIAKSEDRTISAIIRRALENYIQSAA